MDTEQDNDGASPMPPTSRVAPPDAVIGQDLRARGSNERRRGDFTTTSETLRLVPLTIVVGLLGAVVALLLVWLIGFITNALYYQQVDVHLQSPRLNTLGWIAVLIPIAGGLVVGLMARFGSERIRGHGIPEAMETILVGGSRVEPRLTVLKPISSAISIGTGGPFGAEGPIILTGGALGSVIAQFLRLSAIERRCLLVAGAAAGMSGIFGTPIAAVLLGVELLAFEWRPRSMVLIGLASGTADALRHWFVVHGWMQMEPLFPVTLSPMIGSTGIVDALVVGGACGLAAWVLTKAVYGAEDAFRKLPFHWAWWPAIGGLVIGLGGLIEPRVLGVGYDTIADELAGTLGAGTLISVLVVKLVTWAIGLGSGTSGGILAPLLIMGAAIGGLLGSVLPGGTPADWAVLGMSGALAGVMRSPFTALIFAVELTHQVDLFLPLLFTTLVAHFISVLILKRSILTEKVARRGFHVLREYAVDPMDVLFVREVMATDVVTVASGFSMTEARAVLREFAGKRHQRLLPVIRDDELVGVVPWLDIIDTPAGRAAGIIDDLMVTRVITAFPDESLREVAERMALYRIGVLPVVERQDPARLRGLITQFDLLKARERNLQEERTREQVLQLWFLPRMAAFLWPSGGGDERDDTDDLPPS
jgi:H+/Cl- antiporter ClcA/CBS domain-containing protein